MVTAIELFKFFSLIIGLAAFGILLAMYTTGDLDKCINYIRSYKLVEWKPYKDRPWYDKILFKLYLKKKRTRIWFTYHSEIIFKRKIYSHLWHLIIRKCPRCELHGNISLRHQNCSYVNEMSNYYWLCEDCHQEIHDYYQELWDEYYSGRL